jgi:histidinol-phosphatase (PHP family)
MYPSPEILKLAKKHNLPLTLASDAHSPGEVGANFKEAVELALQTGYDQIASFEKRKYTLHPLG